MNNPSGNRSGPPGSGGGGGGANNSAAGGGDQASALSLLVNAADSRDAPQQRGGGAGDPRSLQELQRLRAAAGLGGGGGEPSLEELYLAQQQQQGAGGGGGFGGGGSAALLSQLRDQNMLSQMGQQQQHHHLAALLGLGGGGGAGGGGGNQGGGGGGGGGASGSGSQQQQQQQQQQDSMRQALAAAQMRQQQQQPQFSQADLLALSRSGALSGLLGSGAFGAAGGGGASGGYGGFGGGGGGGGSGPGGFASELESLQRLEEFQRRQRLLQAAAANEQGAGSGASRPNAALERALAGMGGGGREDSATSPSQRPKPDGVHPGMGVFDAATSGLGGGVPTKEDLEKTPGSVIVPCRARGMPMDHNFKTAYFVIPENVKHGEELICSYFACRNAGIKFRYCSQCKVPVAKRNFRKRHKHGGDPVAGGKGDESGGEEDNVAAKKGIPSQITASREEAAEADGISSQSADSDNNQHDSKMKAAAACEADAQQGLLVRNSMRTFETAKNKSKAAAAAGGGATAQPSPKTISAERKDRWVSLLAKRPSTKDSDTMSAWLMEVLAVSDLETPLKTGDAIAAVVGGGEDGVNKATSSDHKKKESNGKAEGSPKKRNGDESPRSDIGYGSSNEDDSGNDNKVKDSAKEGSKEDQEKAAATIVKKKRPAAEVLREELGESEKKSDSYVSGSFAEWKERKKQRKQSKTSTPPPATVPPKED